MSPECASDTAACCGLRTRHLQISPSTASLVIRGTRIEHSTLFYQILGACGVIASIVFAGVQIRRNTRALRAGESQKISESLADMWLTLSGNPELVDLLLRGIDDFDSPNRTDKARFRFAQMGYMRVYENAWFQHEIGILRAEDWTAVLGDMESYLSQSGMQKAWPLIRNRSGASFRGYVDAKISELQARSETRIQTVSD